MRKFVMFWLVHFALGVAILGYTWINSQSLKLTATKEVIQFWLKTAPIALVCHGIFLVVFFAGTRRLGLTFWQVQLAYWATAYIGLILFWKWNGFVPTPSEWVGVTVSLIGSLIPIIWPVIRR